MNNVGGGRFSLTLPAQKTGAYRLTARFQIQGSTNWYWYNSVNGASRRDHAVVVTPARARDISMYELNALNICAAGTNYADRSTFTAQITTVPEPGMVALLAGPGAVWAATGFSLGLAYGLRKGLVPVWTANGQALVGFTIVVLLARHWRSRLRRARTRPGDAGGASKAGRN